MELSPNRGRVLLAVSGSIAAYRAADIVSILTQKGCEVRCVMTQNARHFVTPTVLETLSRNPVYSSQFGPEISGTEHIRLARWADMVVFAPATAHLIAQLALGLADELVTTLALATQAPWLIAPAMNTVMWRQSITQQHVEALKQRGARFVDPDAGMLACGEEGVGKLASVEKISAEVLRILGRLRRTESQPMEQFPRVVEGGSSDARPRDLESQRILITAGPTISHIDAVRYVTNPSTGKMGAAMAEEALRRGARVDYILGVDKGVIRPVLPLGLDGVDPERLRVREVRTAEQMCEAALEWLPEATGVVATAAVLDYRVAESNDGKLKRQDEPIQLRMLPSIDVLAELRARGRENQWFLGFAAETEQLSENAVMKLKKKRLDFLFANRIARLAEGEPGDGANYPVDTGFGSPTNGGLLFFSDGRAPLELAVQSKDSLAIEIWNALSGEIGHARFSRPR